MPEDGGIAVKKTGKCFYFNGGNDALNSKYLHSQVKEKRSLEANIHQRNDKTTAQTSVGQLSDPGFTSYNWIVDHFIGKI